MNAMTSDNCRVIWKRLDVVGHDACRIALKDGTWHIDGTAVFAHAEGPARLAYRVQCSADWTTQSAEVEGWVGARDLRLAIERDDAGRWMLDRTPRPDLDGFSDVDLGFTPATNTNAIRRMDLEIGGEAQTTAAWLDTDDWTIKGLPQIYRRDGRDTFAYASPTHDYHAMLHIDTFGIVTDYPGLWRTERC